MIKRLLNWLRQTNDEPDDGGCRHRWVEVRIESKFDLARDIIEDVIGGTKPYPPPSFCELLTTKVCQDCHKVVDEIKEFQEQYRSELVSKITLEMKLAEIAGVEPKQRLRLKGEK